jgi:hypothetical protein
MENACLLSNEMNWAIGISLWLLIIFWGVQIVWNLIDMQKKLKD